VTPRNNGLYQTPNQRNNDSNRSKRHHKIDNHPNHMPPSECRLVGPSARRAEKAKITCQHHRQCDAQHNPTWTPKVHINIGFGLDVPKLGHGHQRLARDCNLDFQISSLNPKLNGQWPLVPARQRGQLMAIHA
jgi:hypothetical protein